MAFKASCLIVKGNATTPQRFQTLTTGPDSSVQHRCDTGQGLCSLSVLGFAVTSELHCIFLPKAIMMILIMAARDDPYEWLGSVSTRRYWMLRFLVVSLSVVGLVSCGEITPSSRVSSDGMETAEGEYVAGVGDAVMEVVQQENLPNAFGGADIFGRTRPTGTVALYYAGRSGNDAHFVRRDVAIHSARTTMNSSAIVINPSSTTNYSGTFGGHGYSGTSSTVAAPIFLPPNTPQDQITGVREMRVAVPLASGSNSLVIAGRRLTVLNADSNQVKYRVEE